MITVGRNRGFGKFLATNRLLNLRGYYYPRMQSAGGEGLNHLPLTRATRGKGARQKRGNKSPPARRPCVKMLTMHLHTAMHRVAGKWRKRDGIGGGGAAGWKLLRARRLFPRHFCHGIPPDAILAEANRIQRKRSHVHIRCTCTCMCIAYVCARIHARECCRGTVWTLSTPPTLPRSLPIPVAESRNRNPWQSECAKLRRLRVAVSTMSLRPSWFHPRVLAPVLTGSEPGCYGTRNELSGSPRVSHARKESRNSVP